ncbi:hypothetical protein GUJ93_ZPchr0010g7890 [Zizania palustris]|uniref:Uncharacterized protein n=1 Tax=Zizania palustris TaxID=103762 RepID=A0A8J6BHY7_ZIZPA|nr:hypothetical protein GUJ93_ZPchr0010g7890 [Zizania palustris]
MINSSFQTPARALVGREALDRSSGQISPAPLHGRATNLRARPLRPVTDVPLGWSCSRQKYSSFPQQASQLPS